MLRLNQLILRYLVLVGRIMRLKLWKKSTIFHSIWWPSLRRSGDFRLSWRDLPAMPANVATTIASARKESHTTRSDSVPRKEETREPLPSRPPRHDTRPRAHCGFGARQSNARRRAAPYIPLSD